MAQPELFQHQRADAAAGQRPRGGRAKQAGPDDRHLHPFHRRDDSRPGRRARLGAKRAGRRASSHQGVGERGSPCAPFWS